MLQIINTLRKNEDGVTAMEYGLIAAFVALIIIAALGSLGSSLSGLFSRIASSV